MEQTPSIGNLTAGAMIVCALIVDGVQFLLTLTVIGTVFASFLVTPLSSFTFWLWFTLLGVKYIGKNAGRNALIAFGSTVGELIPFVSAIPLTTAGVIGIIVTERIREKKERQRGPNPQRNEAIARLARMNMARANREAQTRAAQSERDQTHTNTSPE